MNILCLLHAIILALHVRFLIYSADMCSFSIKVLKLHWMQDTIRNINYIV